MGLTEAVTEEARNLSAGAGVGASLFGISKVAGRLNELPTNPWVHTVSKFIIESGPNPDLALYSALTLATYGGYVKGARGYTAAALATTIPIMVNKLDAVQNNPLGFLLGDQAPQQTYSTGTILGWAITGYLIGTGTKWLRDNTTGKL